MTGTRIGLSRDWERYASKRDFPVDGAAGLRRCESSNQQLGFADGAQRATLGETCRQPAAFHLIGFAFECPWNKAPRGPHGGQTRPCGYTLKHFDRGELDLCLDHARGIMNDMEPAVRDGAVRITVLGHEQRLTLACRNCFTTVRVSRMTPSTYINSMQYCPVCGKAAAAVIDPDTDWWEAMATMLNMEMAEVQLLHRAWLARFAQYGSNRLDMFIKWAPSGRAVLAAEAEEQAKQVVVEAKKQAASLEDLLALDVDSL